MERGRFAFWGTIIRPPFTFEWRDPPPPRHVAYMLASDAACFWPVFGLEPTTCRLGSQTVRDQLRVRLYTPGPRLTECRLLPLPDETVEKPLDKKTTQADIDLTGRNYLCSYGNLVRALHILQPGSNDPKLGYRFEHFLLSLPSFLYKDLVVQVDRFPDPTPRGILCVGSD